MKQLVLLFLILFGYVGTLRAQDCIPDTTGIPADAYGVFPLPYIETDRPEGGIQDTVCLNRDFEYTFTLKIGGSATVGTITGDVLKVAIAPNGALTYEPELPGFDYVCNPPNCVFLRDSIGCVKIKGTVDDPALIDRYEIKISGTVDAVASGFTFTDIPLTFPSEESILLQGHYYLFVQDANSRYCMGSSTYARFAPDIELANRPNPFSDFTQIHVKSKEEGRFELRVVDMLGQTVSRRPVELHFGENIIDFDGRELANGLYVYTITDGRGGVSGKMVVNHGR